MSRKRRVTYRVKDLLHITLKACYVLRQKLLHIALDVLYLESKVVKNRV